MPPPSPSDLTSELPSLSIFLATATGEDTTTKTTSSSQLTATDAATTSRTKTRETATTSSTATANASPSGDGSHTTSTISSLPSTSPGSPSPTTFTTSTSTAASAGAASTSGITGTILEESCTGLSCSTALKAAVAVPVVVVGLGILFALFIFARRRRRKSPEKSPGKKWTRHLRMFSFDAELLVGGRGSNSLLTGSSVRSDSAQNSVRSQPSLQSLDHPAPPYRDAISTAQPPNMGQISGLGGAAAFGRLTPTDLVRPDSSATAPPPYRAAVAGSDRVRSPTTPTSTSNPFRDSAPVSPVDGSPFADPPEARQTLSRNSSRYQSVRGDDDQFSIVSTRARAEAEDAGSVREAQIARNVSGRIRNT